MSLTTFCIHAWSSGAGYVALSRRRPCFCHRQSTCLEQSSSRSAPVPDIFNFQNTPEVTSVQHILFFSLTVSLTIFCRALEAACAAYVPNVGDYQCEWSLSLINRLRIGHTQLTHSYLLSGDDQPVCSACQSPLTVKHLLIECVNFAAIRSRYFSASSMKDVFTQHMSTHKVS